MIVVISGGFDPVHIGHIDHINEASKLGDKLVVIVQNDKNLEMKKDYYFMEESERMKVMDSMKNVGQVILNIDDDMTSIETLKFVRELYPNDEMIFAKGGDRFIDEIPEKDICLELDISIQDGIGGHLQSSSGLVKRVVDLH